MNPDFSIFSATESLSTNNLVVFAADWKTRTFHRHLTCSVISSELCRKTSFVAEGGSSLIEIIEFCGVIARSPTGKARLCGSEGGSRAADSLFMRRVLLRESLTVIPLMKWKYIFSCRRIWKCLGKKKFKKHWYHSCPPSPPPIPVWILQSDLSDVMLTDSSDLFPFVLIRGPFAEQARSWSYSRSSLSTELTEEPGGCMLLTWIWNKK